MDFDLAQCITGDKAAWDAFVQRLGGVIYAAVARTFKSHGLRASGGSGGGGAGGSRGSGGGGSGGQGEMDDAVQDVFLKLIKDDYRLLRSFDPGRASLVTWLTIVARSTATDRLRRQPRHTVGLSEEHTQQIADPSPPPEVAEATQGQALARVPVDLLTARQKLVLTLVFDRDLEVTQIAQMMGVDEQTVRSTKHKALERLRKHFADNKEAEE